MKQLEFDPSVTLLPSLAKCLVHTRPALRGDHSADIFPFFLMLKSGLVVTPEKVDIFLKLCKHQTVEIVRGIRVRFDDYLFCIRQALVYITSLCSCVCI